MISRFSKQSSDETKFFTTFGCNGTPEKNMLSQKYFENLEIMEVQITLQNRRFGRGVFISMISRFSKHMCRTKFSEDIKLHTY